MGAQASAFHSDFMQTLAGAAAAYAGTEAASVGPLQSLEADILGLINAPTNALLGRPLIGRGVNGASAVQANLADRAASCGATAVTVATAPALAIPAGPAVRLG